MIQKKKIYLDYSATTPCDSAVLSKMLPYFTQNFGNSGSRSHSFGWEAEAAVEEARETFAYSIGVKAKNVIFTSGATESNNIAIKGVSEYLKENRGKNHIITLQTEHKCVIDSCSYLSQRGYEVTYLPVRSNGLVDLELLKAAIKKETGLVSVAWVHNEIGVIQPIQDIATICAERGVVFHSDAAQAFGRIPLNLSQTRVDLVSFSGHKMYGPKGIGALYIKPGVRLSKFISGGGQEKGLRSGTLPVPLCVGLGEAARIANGLFDSEYQKAVRFRDYMYNEIMKLPDVHLNGDFDQRVPHNLNFSFGGVEGESLMMCVPHLALSSGSACTSGSLEPSYVIGSLGLEHELVHTAIRIVTGRFTSIEDIIEATDDLVGAVQKMRNMSPLWHLKQSGVDLNTIHWTE
jgi:cysteine desulfurase